MKPLVCLALTALSVFTVPAFADPTDLTDCDIAPQCSPLIIKGLNDAWARGSYGLTAAEAGFCMAKTFVDGKCVPLVQDLPQTNEHKKITFTYNPNCRAIYHSHPIGTDPKPSDNDRAIGDKFKIPMYTMSRSGLYLYDPRTRKTTLVRSGMDWTGDCK